ncbi:MAG: TonB-dependent receptor, partial [Planctomycetaceae bacterium]
MKKLKGWGILFPVLGCLAGMSPGAMGAEVELGQVVVTSTKTEMEITESPQSISVITKEEINSTPDRSIAEVIQRAPGVLITNNGPMGSLTSANIRGSEAGQVLIMIDGRRINDPQNGQFDLSNL